MLITKNWFFILVNTILLLFYISISLFITSYQKKSVAKILTQTIQSSLTAGEIRESKHIIEKVLQQNFNAIKYKKGKREIFAINSSNKSYLTNNFTITTWKANKKSDSYYLEFHYSIIGSLFYSFCIWLGSLFVTFILIKRERKSAHIKHQQELIIQKNEEYVRLSKIVAHDIRSPLAALNMATSDIDELPESSRKIIKMSLQRIHDIANNLLNRDKEKVNISRLEEIEDVDLYPCLNEIVSEKRMQFRDMRHIHITTNLNQNVRLFIKARSSELKRIISNLINNSVEAMAEQSGVINLDLGTDKNKQYVLIAIRDNGKGIPKEFLDKIGQEGGSYGKELSSVSGSGLGLYSAIKTIQSWGGRVDIQSKVNKGTLIKLSIPLLIP